MIFLSFKISGVGFLAIMEVFSTQQRMSTNIEPVVAHDEKSKFFIIFPEMVSIETWCDFFS